MATNKIKNKIIGYNRRGWSAWVALLKRRQLHHKNFTIIASNCIGARIYQEFHLPYNTPFVGLFLFAPCYIKLISDLEYYLSSPLSFTDVSKYSNSSHTASKEGILRFNWPIGLLGGDVEVHFQHYKDRHEATAKWSRRLKRMNMHDLFFLFTDRDHCTMEHLEQFDRMPFSRKICFTARHYSQLDSIIFLPEYRNESHVGDITTEFNVCRRHFDYIDWLNGGNGKTHYHWPKGQN